MGAENSVESDTASAPRYNMSTQSYVNADGSKVVGMALYQDETQVGTGTIDRSKLELPPPPNRHAGAGSFGGSLFAAFEKDYEEQVDEYYADLMAVMRYALECWKLRKISTSEAKERCDEVLESIEALSVINADRAQRYLSERGISGQDRFIIERNYQELRLTPGANVAAPVKQSRRVC